MARNELSMLALLRKKPAGILGRSPISMQNAASINYIANMGVWWRARDR